MPWWSQFFPQRSLKGITTATRVSLQATVGGRHLVTSFLTGVRAVYFQYTFFREVVAKDAADKVMYIDIGTQSHGTNMQLECDDGIVEIDPNRMIVAFVGAQGHGVLLNQPLPASMAAINEKIGVSGQVFLREMNLTVGEEVTFRGIVEPLRGDSPQGPFRQAPHDLRPRFRVCGKRGPAHLTQKLRLG